MDKMVCEVRSITKRFQKRGPAVFAPVSFSLHAGEILGISGENGAGKSTLVEILAGVQKPDGGKIVYGEGVKGRIGYVPQEIALYDDLKAEENLAFFGRASGLPEKFIRIRSRYLLEQLSLLERRRDLTGTFSGGMKRKLHLASALMLTPRLLLLDEVTEGVDETSCVRMFDLIQKTARQGCGVVFISHREGEEEKLCNRILSLQKEEICIG